MTMRAAATTLALLLVAAPRLAASVEPFTFQILATSEEILSEPRDLAVSTIGNRLYVADTGNDRVVVLDPITLRELGRVGEGELSRPHDVAFDRLGRLLVADTGNGRIAIYEVRGESGSAAGEIRGTLRAPAGVVVHADGRVLVTDADAGELAVFRDGEEEARSGGLSAPHDVHVDGKGVVWVADSGNRRVVRISRELELGRAVGGEEPLLARPRYLAFDAGGRMFVADEEAHAIKVLDADGSVVQELGGPQPGRGDGQFDGPQGIEIRAGDAWISDTRNNRVVRYRMQTRVVQ